jgi:hypothetical protein
VTEYLQPSVRRIALDAGGSLLLVTGGTRSVPNQVFTWINGPMRLRRGGRFHRFEKKCCTLCNIFSQNEIEHTMLPQAKTAFMGVQV